MNLKKIFISLILISSSLLSAETKELSVVTAPDINTPKIVFLAKTVSVSHDWDDGVEAVPEATLSYRTRIKNSGTATAKEIVLSDDIPKNTTYVRNSLKSSLKTKSYYYDSSTKKWSPDQPKNPARVKKIRFVFQENLNAGQEAWIEYAAKINY